MYVHTVRAYKKAHRYQPHPQPYPRVFTHLSPSSIGYNPHSAFPVTSTKRVDIMNLNLAGLFTTLFCPGSLETSSAHYRVD